MTELEIARQRQKTKRVGMLKDLEIGRFVGMLKQADCTVTEDYDAGTVEAKDGDKTVFKALRKGKRGQPWIVRYGTSERIRWN